MEIFFLDFYFKTFWPNYNTDLRSYGQLLSLFSIALELSLFQLWDSKSCLKAKKIKSE